jgi:hypothetical protein
MKSSPEIIRESPQGSAKRCRNGEPETMHHALGSFSVDLGPNEIGEPNVRSGETWTRGSNVSKWPGPPRSACLLSILPPGAMRRIPDFRPSRRLLPVLLRARRRVAVTDNNSAFTTPTRISTMKMRRREGDIGRAVSKPRRGAASLRRLTSEQNHAPTSAPIRDFHCGGLSLYPSRLVPALPEVS